MERRRRGRFPTKDELELWAKVTRHDEPLERELTHAPEDAASGAIEEVTVRAEPPKPARESQSAPLPPAAPSAPVQPAGGFREPPPAQPFDPRAAKHLARGRRPIDARLDLHGMRQQDAHASLRHFIARCQADGLRHVLIITGKGISAERHSARDFWTSEERGVLRRLVPHWLSEPSMRVHVVSFTESHTRHGGSGALYVTLRKGPRGGS
jgi:DNA-nicking Smr family endonuclease